MKILRFDDERIGVLKGDAVVDISEVISHREYRGPQGSMEELISRFDAYKPEIEKLVAKGGGKPLSQVKLLAPLPRPGRVLAAFVNYLDRPDRTADGLVIEFFHKSPHLVPPGGSVVLPNIEAVSEFHAEAELAFVCGKPCQNAKAADWKDYV